MKPKTMNRKKGFAALITILQIYLPAFSQGWQPADIYSKESFQTLQLQYQNAETLPIEERLRLFKAGTQAARHHRDSGQIQQFAYRVASTANALDSLDTALKYIAIARSAVSEKDDYAVNIINYQGVLHKQAGDYEQALAYYEEALQLARNKFPDKLIMPLSNIATLYRSQKNYQKTLEYLREINEITAELEPPGQAYHRVYNYAEFCIVHKTLNNLDSALHYGQLCIQNLNRLDKRLNMKTVGFAYITVSELYIEKLQQPERAKPLLDSAFLYVEGLYINKVKVSLGKYYLAIGALKETGTIVRELQEADIKSQTTRLRALELAEQYYATIGDFESALASVKVIQQMDAELFNEEKARLTAFYSANSKIKSSRKISGNYSIKSGLLNGNTKPGLLSLSWSVYLLSA
jgi:tetratricopeptide (TPR) repeat protein